jgi:uncharacterized protein YbjT (DUF2867 family)
MILVTGATGRPGSAVIREFARHGTHVRALARDPAKAAALRGLRGVDVAFGDMLAPETLDRALAGVDRVLMISGAGPQLLETQCTFIDAAKRAGVAHIVKFSGQDSIDGFDPERFRSTRSHEQIQRYLVGAGTSWTILRPSQFMQVYFEETPTIIATGELRLPLGEATLAPVDIADIAKAAYQIVTTPGHQNKTYTMTGPEALTMTELATRIEAAVGKSVRYVDVSSKDKLREWLKAGYPPARAEAFVQLFDERRRLGRSTVDLSTHRHFGITPTTFAEFARRHSPIFRGEAEYHLTPN